MQIMAGVRRTQTEILEEIVSQLRDQAYNQAIIAEILNRLQNEGRRTQNGDRYRGNGEETEDADSITRFLGEFRKVNPPSFAGSSNPTVGQKWIKQLEKIFHVMKCTPEQKLTLAIYKLEGEAEYWWEGAKKFLESKGEEVNWENFQTVLFNKYPPDSVRKRMEAEFLQIKQGLMTVREYKAKFDELSKFSSYLNNMHDEAWKTSHSERGLRSEIKDRVGTFELTNFSQLVNKYQIVEAHITYAKLEKEAEAGLERKREDREGPNNRVRAFGRKHLRGTETSPRRTRRGTKTRPSHLDARSAAPEIMEICPAISLALLVGSSVTFPEYALPQRVQLRPGHKTREDFLP